MSEPADSTESPNPLPPEPFIREQVQLLYNGLPLSLISSLIIGLLLSISHLPVVGQAEIIYWNLILGVTLILRLILWQFWLNAGALYSAKCWLQLFRVGAWIAGVAWGVAPLLIYADDNSIFQALLTFCLAGVVSGSLTSLSADRLSALGFSILAVCPLTLLLILNKSPVSVAMSVMTVLFIIFVVSSSGRTQKELRSQIQQNEALMALGEELQENRDIDSIITKIQSQFISEHNFRDSLQGLINETSETCECNLGFIADVRYDEKNQPYMRMLSYSYKKNDSNYDFFSMVKSSEPQEFRNLNGLFGKIIKTQKPVFSENPRKDIRSIGTPENHPEIFNFLGIPIFHANELIAVLGLANSTKAFSHHTINKLIPVINLISQLISTSQLQYQHKQDIAVLEEASVQTKTILDDIADGIITIDQYGIIRSFNKAAETIFGYNAEQIVGSNVDMLMPDKNKQEHNDRISQHLKTGNSKIIGVGREVVGVRRNGKHFPMDLMVSKVTQKGEPLFIGVVRDISEKINLLEAHNNQLKKLATELRVPSHALSLALSILESSINQKSLGNCENMVRSARAEQGKLQEKIQSIIYDGSKTKISAHDLKEISAFEAIQYWVDSYRHIASFRGMKLALVNNLHDEVILATESHLEKSIIYLLSLAVESNQETDDIKIFLDQSKGKIRIYFVVKNRGYFDSILNKSEWEFHKKEFLRYSSVLETEKIAIADSAEQYDVVYINFLLAITK